MKHNALQTAFHLLYFVYGTHKSNKKQARQDKIMLDRIDRRLLSVLQGDGRIAAVELAEAVGLSATATGERLKRLVREGYITQ